MRPVRILAATNTIDPRRILNGLRHDHPRLLLDGQRLDHLRYAALPEEQRLAEALRGRGERLLDEPQAELTNYHLGTARAFLDRMYTLGMLAQLDGDDRAARRAIKDALAIAALPDWGQEASWLACAETMHGMALAIDWLQPWLAVDEDHELRSALLHTGIGAAEQAYAERAWWWRDPANWNIVCNASVLIACLVVGHDAPRQARRCAAHALEGLPLALASLANDGGWDEGPGYWGLSMRYLTALSESLLSALGHDFDLFDLPGMTQAGVFRCHITGPSGRFAAFADSYQDPGFDPALFVLATRGDPTVAALARARLEDVDQCIFFGGAARGLLWFNHLGDLEKLPKAGHFPSCAVATARSGWGPRDGWLAIKGGDVQGPHAHADCGSLVYEHCGVRWFDDPGAGDYAQTGYWNGRPGTDLARWSIPVCATTGHSTLRINNANQDLLARAAIAAFHDDGQHMRCTVDGDECYAEQGVTRWRRHVLFDGRSGSARIEDEVMAERPVTAQWQVVTAAGAEVIPGGVELSEGSHRCHLACPMHPEATWRVEPVHGDDTRWAVILDLPAASQHHIAVAVTCE